MNRNWAFGILASVIVAASMGVGAFIWRATVLYITADQTKEIAELKHRLDMNDYARKCDQEWMRLLHGKLDEARQYQNMGRVGTP